MYIYFDLLSLWLVLSLSLSPLCLSQTSTPLDPFFTREVFTVPHQVVEGRRFGCGCNESFMFWVGEQEPKQRDHSKPRPASPEPPATSPPPDESDLELLQEKQNLEEQLARLQAKLNKAKEGKVKAERSISRSDPPAPSSRRASPAPSTSAKRAPSQAPSRTPSQAPSGKRSSSEGPKPSSRMVRQNAFVDLANRRPVAAPSRARTLPPRVEEIQEDDRDAEEDEELDQEAMEEEEEEETQERKTSGRTQVLNSGKYGTIHDSKTGQDFWLVLTYTCVVLLFH